MGSKAPHPDSGVHLIFYIVLGPISIRSDSVKRVLNDEDVGLFFKRTAPFYGSILHLTSLAHEKHPIVLHYFFVGRH
jgi:hypothetical protein